LRITKENTVEGNRIIEIASINILRAQTLVVLAETTLEIVIPKSIVPDLGIDHLNGL